MFWTFFTTSFSGRPRSFLSESLVLIRNRSSMCSSAPVSVSWIAVVPAGGGCACAAAKPGARPRSAPNVTAATRNASLRMRTPLRPSCFAERDNLLAELFRRRLAQHLVVGRGGRLAFARVDEQSPARLLE